MQAAGEALPEYDKRCHIYPCMIVHDGGRVATASGATAQEPRRDEVQMMRYLINIGSAGTG
jgi:hypothetical protein